MLTSQKSEKRAWDTRGIHLSTRLSDVMYRVREGKSKLEPFYRLFRELFSHIFLAPGLITCLNRVWNYCYVYRSDLRWLNRVMQDHEARASNLDRKFIFSLFLLFS